MLQGNTVYLRLLSQEDLISRVAWINDEENIQTLLFDWPTSIEKTQKWFSNVVFDNIRMEGVLTPVVINMWYNCCDPDRHSEYVWSREALPVDERTPHLGTFHFSNMICTDAEVAACYIDGLPESPIESVSFENVSVSFSETAKPGIPAMENFAEERCRLGLYLDNVRHITLRNVKLEGVVGPSVIADHYETLSREEFRESEDEL